MHSIPRFNKHLATLGIPLELVKGQGYLYFITVPPRAYASRTVYVCYFNHLTTEQWIDRAREAWDDMQEHGDGNLPADHNTHH